MILERRTVRSTEVIELNDLAPTAALPMRRRLDRHPGAPGCGTSPVSRRHHGGRPHRSGGALRHDPPRDATNGADAVAPPARPAAAPAQSAPVRSAPRSDRDVLGAERPALPDATLAGGNGSAHVDADASGQAGERAPAGQSPVLDGGPHGVPSANGVTTTTHEAGRADHDSAGSCTAPQLRRFIKSRPYVPMHELRRRFGINGHDDDVTPVDLGRTRVYVGLPHREGSLLGELLRGGEIGYELSLDPHTPVVVGLYPMRPIARN
jgi:hypothetical protein